MSGSLVAVDLTPAERMALDAAAAVGRLVAAQDEALTLENFEAQAIAEQIPVSRLTDGNRALRLMVDDVAVVVVFQTNEAVEFLLATDYESKSSTPVTNGQPTDCSRGSQGRGTHEPAPAHGHDGAARDRDGDEPAKLAKAGGGTVDPSGGSGGFAGPLHAGNGSGDRGTTAIQANAVVVHGHGDRRDSLDGSCIVVDDVEAAHRARISVRDDRGNGSAEREAGHAGGAARADGIGDSGSDGATGRAAIAGSGNGSEVERAAGVTSAVGGECAGHGAGPGVRDGRVGAAPADFSGVPVPVAGGEGRSGVRGSADELGAVLPRREAADLCDPNALTPSERVALAMAKAELAELEARRTAVTAEIAALREQAVQLQRTAHGWEQAIAAGRRELEGVQGEIEMAAVEAERKKGELELMKAKLAEHAKAVEAALVIARDALAKPFGGAQSPNALT